MAVVLTYNAPEAVAQCIDAIGAQSATVGRVLVVDNASVPPVRVPSVPGLSVEVLRLPENIGPAGGYAAGLRAFLASDFAWAWLVDDDCAAQPDALQEQLRAAGRETGPAAILATMVDRDTGEVVNTHGWCGVLIPHEIVSTVGLPFEEFFWWSEDTEYLQWRIPEAGFGLTRCADAVVEVSLRRAERVKPTWKFYYEARNQVYFRLRVQRQSVGRPRRRHLTRRVRTWRAARTVLKLSARAALREPERRVAKLGMVWRGAADGARGRLGRTVVVNVADRPLVASRESRSVGRVEDEEPGG